MEIQKNRYDYNENGIRNLKPFYVSNENDNGAPLSIISAKGYEVIKICKNAFPNDLMGNLSKEEYEKRILKIGADKGIFFIYVPDFVFGSGAADLAKIFTENGYELFNQTQSVFAGAGGVIGLSACPTSNTSVYERTSRVHAAPRIALMHSKTTAPEIKAIFDTLNSKENRYGQYLQILISSRVGQEGININNAVGMIMFSPTWNYARRRQAEDRIFRATSHVDRISDYKKYLRFSGKYTAEEVEKFPFPIKVYNMASVYVGDNLPDIEDTDEFRAVYDYIINNPVYWSDEELIQVYEKYPEILPHDEMYQAYYQAIQNGETVSLPLIQNTPAFASINNYIANNMPVTFTEEEIRDILTNFEELIPNDEFRKALLEDLPLPNILSSPAFRSTTSPEFQSLNNYIKIQQWSTSKLMKLYQAIPTLLPTSQEYKEKYNHFLSNPIFYQHNLNTTDVKRFILTEQKDKSIRKIMRYVKRASVSCYTNRIRNMEKRITDQDGSPMCDYDSCQYECSGIRKDIMETTDWTTKVLFYYKDEVDEAMTVIKEIFNKDSALTVEQILLIVKQKIAYIEDIFILMAIEELIDKNIKILDRFGYPTYLRDSKTGIIYLESDRYNNDRNPDDTYYSNLLLATQNPKQHLYINYISALEIKEQLPLLNTLFNLPPNSPDFRKLLENLSIANKIMLVEWAIETQFKTGSSNEFINSILNTFVDSIYTLQEPVNQLNYAEQKIANRGKTRGRKPKGDKINTKGWEIPPIDPSFQGENVYIHRLNRDTSDNVKYAKNAKFFNIEGNMRIFKPSENLGWRNLNVAENIIYKYNIKSILQGIYDYYKQMEIFAKIIPPLNLFQIVDLTNININVQPSDTRGIPGGKICGDWFKYQLVELMYKLVLKFGAPLWPPGFTTETYNFIATNYNREYLIREIIHTATSEGVNNFDLTKLIFYYVWYDDKYNGHHGERESICHLLKNYFISTGRVFTGETPKNIDMSIFNQPLSPDISDNSSAEDSD